MELWCTNQAKHVGVKFQFIRDIVSQEVVTVDDLHTENNKVNMVTTSMIGVKFKGCLNLINVMSFTN